MVWRLEDSPACGGCWGRVWAQRQRQAKVRSLRAHSLITWEGSREPDTQVKIKGLQVIQNWSQAMKKQSSQGSPASPTYLNRRKLLGSQTGLPWHPPAGKHALVIQT